MSISKLFTATAALFLTVSSINADTPAIPDVTILPIVTPEQPVQATVAELRKAALALHEANKAYFAHPCAQRAELYKKILKISVVNSALEGKDIAHAVKKQAGKKERSSCAKKCYAVKKEEIRKLSKEERSLAKEKVIGQVKKYLAKNEEIKKEEQRVLENSPLAVQRAVEDYYLEMTRVYRQIPEIYAQRAEARDAFKQMVSGLLQQGISSDEIQKEIREAGISCPFILNKVRHLARS